MSDLPSLPIRLPAVEQRWSCHGCSGCCRSTVVPLDEEDLRKLRAQQWEGRPELEGLPPYVRTHWWKGRYQLGKRPDGTCVFLMDDGRCRIHAEHGLEAKPWRCRMFPRQVVTLGSFAYLTLRRHCPSAARDLGQPLGEQEHDVLEIYRSRGRRIESQPPPWLTRRVRRNWRDTLAVLEGLRALMLDERYPPVRRLVHGLHFCDALEQCRMAGFEGDRAGELVRLLVDASTAEAGGVFRQRQPARGQAAMLFRQAALEYVWLHPWMAPEFSWRQRLRMIRASFVFARGQGPLPPIHPRLPAVTFAQLEQPLGAIDRTALQPLHAYLESAAATSHFALLGRRGWPVADSFRALALSFAVGLWMLRWVAAGGNPTEDQAVEIVGMIDRGQGYAPLSGPRHRQRVRALARTGALDRLVAWYIQ